jgi:hypothetical protein
MVSCLRLISRYHIFYSYPIRELTIIVRQQIVSYLLIMVLLVFRKMEI